MARSKQRQPAGVAGHAARVSRMATEIPAATLTTLAFRLPMLWAAMASPKAARDPELSRMVTEKVVAAGRSARAVARGGQAAVSALHRHQTLPLASLAPVKAALASPNPAAALDALWRQGMLTADAAATLAAEMASIGTRTVSMALAPMHGRVTANARRLSKRGPARAKTPSS